jgi:L,D-transpeptidase catalytic domain
MGNPSRSELRSACQVCILFLLAFSTVRGRAQEPAAESRIRSPRLVVVSVQDRKLAVTESGNVLAIFPIAVGAPSSPSPSGEFTIVTRVQNPSYYHRGSVIPSGKENPVGTRWLGLNKKGYGIHGTNAPHSIGQAASHGCIRLRNQDVERLFTLLEIGDRVQIHGERDDQVAQVFPAQAADAAILAAQNDYSAPGEDQVSNARGLGN